MFVQGPMVTDEEFEQLPPEEWRIIGRIVQSSNNALLVENNSIRGIYKSVSLERPLWDFPTSTLCLRELQAYKIDRLIGFNLIPSTVWIDSNDLAPGIVQQYVEDAETIDVRLINENVESNEWVTILKGSVDDEDIYLQHTLSDDVWRAAVLDVLINNSDRKAGHMLRDSSMNLWLIDHGVCFHVEDKLRTVLWGWIGQALPGDLYETLGRVQRKKEWKDSWILSDEELFAFENRMNNLLANGMPEPSDSWPSLPSPLF